MLEQMPSANGMSSAGLFAGIGGFERGLLKANIHPLMLCENDPLARLVLLDHFPDVDLVGDIRELDSLPSVDVVAAGFPCTDLSQAGRTAGISGEQSGLVEHVFRLIATAHPNTTLILENVPFMLSLNRGSAMSLVVDRLEALGFKWAYRVVDARSFGLPQRRRRVILVASRTSNPWDVLLVDSKGTPPATPQFSKAGFYWTEGNTGLGWTLEGIPPLKGSSGFGIPSPPAIWERTQDTFVTPDLRDAEALQGFPRGWTRAVEPQRARWKLIGNAVSVPLVEWVGTRIRRPGVYESAGERLLVSGGKWPSAARGEQGKRYAVSISEWPLARSYRPLTEFLREPGAPLSLRAASGFLKRARASSLRFSDEFLPSLERYVEAARSTTPPQDPKSLVPNASSEAARRRLRATRQRDTNAEMNFRQALTRKGLRGYRLHWQIPTNKRRTIDIAFVGRRVALFMDGCFWHSCPQHGTTAKANAQWWQDKLEANKRRDEDTNSRLTDAGWTVVRVWEHEDADQAADELARMLQGKLAETWTHLRVRSTVPR